MKSHTVALDRALSKLGILSRSVARKSILEGKVKINGRLITNPEQRFIPERITIEVDGLKTNSAQEIYIVFHKPVGYITTAKDEKNRPTIFELLPKHFGKLTTVGRLDRNTSGLLLLTTNTQVANYLTDPQNAIERKYVVNVQGCFTENDAKLCILGIEDKEEILKALSVSILKTSTDESQIEIILTQGKNREIRRMMNKINHPVIKLERISFGKITLDLPIPGSWKTVDHFIA